MPTATPEDVRVEIETYLDDPAISNIISRVDRDIGRELSSPPADDTADRRDLEAVLAARHIVTTRDRTASSTQTGRTSNEYEASVVEELTVRAKRLGATDALLGLGDVTKPHASISVLDGRQLED